MVNVRADEVPGWTETEGGWTIVRNEPEKDTPAGNEVGHLKYDVPLSALGEAVDITLESVGSSEIGRSVRITASLDHPEANSNQDPPSADNAHKASPDMKFDDFSAGDIVKPLLFIVVMLWAGKGQAALIYLDANFASDTVASDSTGLNVVETLTANSSGVVWGAERDSTNLYKITGGNYESFPFTPAGVGAVRTKDSSTTYVGEYYTGSSAPAKIYEVSSGGVLSEFVTLPNNYHQINKMAVSPVNGDILINASSTADNRLMKYNSAGVLQWNAAMPSAAFQAPVAYSPSGQAYVAGAAGDLFAINDSDGSTALHSASFPSEWAQYGVIHDMVFSSEDNLFASIVTSTLEVPDLLNNVEITRTNLATNASDLLAHWDFHVPLNERWLEYVDGQGLYLNSFDAGALVPPSIQSSFGPSFSLESSVSSVLLLQGDFNGPFAGFSFVSLAPEPSSVWLLLGLGLAWKRKLANRHSPPGTNSR